MSAPPSDHATRSARADQQSHVDDSSVGVADLLGRLSDQFTTLVRQEVELAKAEAKHEARTAAKAGAGYGAAGLTAFFMVMFASLAAAWGLAELLPAWLAFLIVAAVYGVAAAILLGRAKKQTDQLHPDLPKTRDSLTDDIDWAKDKKP